MKCENCGKNEVSFVYRSNINGHERKRQHLCQRLRGKAGLYPAAAAQSRRTMPSFFGTASLAMMISSDDFFSSHALPAGPDEPDAGKPLR